MRKSICTIKQYDYSSEAEFNQHKKEMEDKGYKLINNESFGGMLQHGEITGSDTYKYTACYIKQH